MLHPRTYEDRPLWGRAVYTALHGARLSSVPSGDQSANPASVPGRSGFQRAVEKCDGKTAHRWGIWLLSERERSSDPHH